MAANETSYAEQQSKIINEIVEVFERNNANIFDVYRISNIMYQSSKEIVSDTIAGMGEQFDELIEALEGVRDALSELDSE